MTFIVITILLSCLSMMAVRGRRGAWPPGMPVTRPRLVTAGGTYEGSRGHPSDAYVIQERLIVTVGGAVRPGGSGDESDPEDGDTDGARVTGAGHAAALALGTVVAARPQRAGAREEDLDRCARAAHRAVRAAAQGDPAACGVLAALDLVVLDSGDRPRLRFAHFGDGGIWHCPKGRPPRPLTTREAGPPRARGPASSPRPEVGTVHLHPGDRVVIVTDGVIRALGVPRMTELFADGRSPATCLDGLYDEMAAAEPKDDATVIIADFVTV